MISGPFGDSYQVNVDGLGRNIVGDAANEPSLCVDPNNTDRMAVGWRQFDSVTNSFRQAGWAWSTNGGQAWTFGGVLETNVFRSDPVLASDADGNFYYLSLQPTPVFSCDLWRSTNGGVNWRRVGPALGGDKAWMTIDTTTSPGRGHMYQCWSVVQNVYTNRIFSRSSDTGVSWDDPIRVPSSPFWATVDAGPDGELYHFGWEGRTFWINRSTNAVSAIEAVRFDLTRLVDLGGGLIFAGEINPEGLPGQPWVAVDKSPGTGRGNVYVLCTVAGLGNPLDVMFARSTDRGETWSEPMRLNDDPDTQNAFHWFGTLSVAPNGRVDACWYDTRGSSNNASSQLYYCCSVDNGVSWSTNRVLTPPFNHSLGYPVQRKIGDYIGMVSLNDSACIAYSATFNGEEDIYFVRVEAPLTASVAKAGTGVQITWNALPGRRYCIQSSPGLMTTWEAAANVACIVATNYTMRIDLPITGSEAFYRIMKQP